MAVVAAYLLPLRHYGLDLLDDGWYLHPVLRMMDGEILYRDLWTVYAPLRHHVFVVLYDLFGPSLVVSRTFFALLIVSSVGIVHRVALRLVAPPLAWIPALLYGLIPGPWHKAPYGFCTVLFFLVLARAFARPTSRRFVLLGAVSGLTLITRQDLGVAQSALAAAAALLPLVWPGSGGLAVRLAPGVGLRRLGAVLAGGLLVVLPVAAWYLAHGALFPMLDAMFVRSVVQQGTKDLGLLRLLSPKSFGSASEGRAVGVIMLVPLALYPAVAITLWRRARRGLDPAGQLVLFLLPFAIATLAQAYQPMLLLRFLQSAIPCYLLASWGVTRWRSLLPGRVQAGAAFGVLIAVAGLMAGVTIVGVPRVHPGDQFTGSVRMARYDAPVALLGDTFLVDGELAYEIRMVRRFVGEQTRHGEPLYSAPQSPLYYPLLDRPNPTRVMGTRVQGDFVMTDAEKRREMQRLLASEARYALADRGWLSLPGPDDAVKEILLREFVPVRGYGNRVILARDGGDPRLSGLLQRWLQRRPAASDLNTLRQISEADPGAPLPKALEAEMLVRSGDLAGAVAALEEQAKLDPMDPRPLERLAALHMNEGRLRTGARALGEASRRGETPTGRRLRARLPAALREISGSRPGQREPEDVGRPEGSGP